MTKKIYSEQGRTAITYLSVTAVVIGSVFLVNGLILAWSSPTQTPPGDNVPAPLNVGSGTQTKDGGLNISGSVGIGTASLSGHQLDIASYQGTTGNSAIRALYPGGGGLADTEFAALAHRDNAWTALYAKQGAASSAAYFDGNILLGNNKTIYGTNRMHVYGDEILYLLNRDGVIISQAWGGSGNLTVDGTVTAAGIAGGAWTQIMDHYKCNDSDGGKNYTVAGVTTKMETQAPDYCVNDYTLVEYFCDGNDSIAGQQILSWEIWLNPGYYNEYKCVSGQFTRTCDYLSCYSSGGTCIYGTCVYY